MEDPSRDVPRAVSGRGEGGVSLVDYGVHLVRKLAFDLKVGEGRRDKGTSWSLIQVTVFFLEKWDQVNFCMVITLLIFNGF